MFDFSLTDLLVAFGNDPFTGMWLLFRSGGWVIFVWIFLWMAEHLWLEHVQEKAAHKKEFIVLRATAPRMSEQTPKAAENIFTALAAAGSGASWTGKWIRGAHQSPVSMEIVSLEGEVSFYLRIEKRLRDLAEAAIFAQYPDTDIDIVEDYAKLVPVDYPDAAYDLWGTELTVTKSDAYPLKTYEDFTDQVSGEMKDPIAVMLENLSRLGPGEQFWYQIVMMPTDQKAARERASAEVGKIRGEVKAHAPTLVDTILHLPIDIIQEILSIFLPRSEKKHDDKKKDGPPKMQLLSPGERLVLEAIERKTSKIGFMCKIRVVYVAKKEKLQPSKVVTPFMGAVRQLNTFHMQSLVPNSKSIGMNGDLWWFKTERNNARKNRIIRAYRDRSAGVGLPMFFLSSEELATLWHFPILAQVKAPLLRKTQAKKSEPPSNIPFGE
ncbi:hypothetical protein KBB27_00460 [Patescibacteria group bacterium]|nr:hypothetical protein [Patescibacteria group bacterium]